MTAAASATNLPATQHQLVGRDDVLQRLTRLTSAYRVVTLTGPGGIGKTALALAAAHAVRTDFADGAWLVELASRPDPLLYPWRSFRRSACSPVTSRSRIRQSRGRSETGTCF